MAPPPGKGDIALPTRKLKSGKHEEMEIGVALSVNGTLQSVYDRVPDDAKRPQGYKPVAIGEPLLVHYLRFAITTEDLTSDVDKILISTYLKVEETKEAAAELVTYYDPSPKVSGGNKRYVLVNFAPKNYGHELIMYTPAYTGETVRLGTNIWELDSPNKPFFKALGSLVSGTAALPIFADLLPLSVSANQVLSIVQALVQFLNKDDSIFSWDGVSLHHDLDNSPRLQAGRYVVALGITSATLRGGQYTLSPENELLREGVSVEASSYIIFQVTSTRADKYKGFNHALGAADVMRRINRPGSEDIETAAKDVVLAAMTALNDSRVVSQIRDLAADAKSDPKSKEKIQALQKNLTTGSASALAPWIEKIVG